MRNRTISAIIMALSLTISPLAFGEWTGSTEIERVRAYVDTSPYVLVVWFSDDVAPSSCSHADRAVVKTTDGTVLENLRDVAMAAFLSGREVEVLTGSGCSAPRPGSGHGDVGDLEYLSIH